MAVIDEIQSRYKKTESVADKHGRLVVVKMLSPSQQLTVRELAPSGDQTVIGMLSLAASVVSVDGHPWPFAKNRKELDGYVDALDEGGLAAVGEAYAKFAEAEKTQQQQLADAKNLPATAS